MHDYLVAMGLGRLLPDFTTLAFAVLLAATEFFLGISMLFAIRRRLVSKLVLAIMAIMTPLTLWLVIANPISDCGCFGDALVLTNWQTFGKNVILLCAAIVVWKWPLDMPRLISRTNQWIVMNYSLVFILLFISAKSGADIREGWNKMMEGSDSPYTEFFIEGAEDGEDLTEQILNDKGYTFLLIAPHLEQADDSRLDEINQMYEYSLDNGYPFYCLTASGEKAIEKWRDLTGAEYPFCLTDDITLKTIVRSNPGLVLMKDGKVIRKWSHNNLPEEEELSEKLEDSELGQLPTAHNCRQAMGLDELGEKE